MTKPVKGHTVYCREVSWFWHLLRSQGEKDRGSLLVTATRTRQNKQVAQCFFFFKEGALLLLLTSFLKICQNSVQGCLYSSHKRTAISTDYNNRCTKVLAVKIQPTFCNFVLLLYYSLPPCLSWSATLCNLSLDKGHVWWPHAKDYVLLIWFSLRTKLSASGEDHNVGLS